MSYQSRRQLEEPLSLVHTCLPHGGGRRGSHLLLTRHMPLCENGEPCGSRSAGPSEHRRRGGRDIPRRHSSRRDGCRQRLVQCRCGISIHGSAACCSGPTGQQRPYSPPPVPGCWWSTSESCGRCPALLCCWRCAASGPPPWRSSSSALDLSTGAVYPAL